MVQQPNSTAELDYHQPIQRTNAKRGLPAWSSFSPGAPSRTLLRNQCTSRHHACMPQASPRRPPRVHAWHSRHCAIHCTSPNVLHVCLLRPLQGKSARRFVFLYGPSELPTSTYICLHPLYLPHLPTSAYSPPFTSNHPSFSPYFQHEANGSSPGLHPAPRPLVLLRRRRRHRRRLPLHRRSRQEWHPPDPPFQQRLLPPFARLREHRGQVRGARLREQHGGLVRPCHHRHPRRALGAPSAHVEKRRRRRGRRGPGVRTGEPEHGLGRRGEQSGP